MVLLYVSLYGYGTALLLATRADYLVLLHSGCGRAPLLAMDVRMSKWRKIHGRRNNRKMSDCPCPLCLLPNFKHSSETIAMLIPQRLSPIVFDKVQQTLFGKDKTIYKLGFVGYLLCGCLGHFSFMVIRHYDQNNL